MSHRHRVRPNRRREDIGYTVDVWRSMAVLVTEDPPLADGARRLLALSLVEIFNQGRMAGLPSLGRDADEFIATVKELYRKGWLGVEDGRAFTAYPERDALGRVVATRVPQAEMGDFVEAMRQSLEDDGFLPPSGGAR